SSHLLPPGGQGVGGGVNPAGRAVHQKAVGLCAEEARRPLLRPPQLSCPVAGTSRAFQHFRHVEAQGVAPHGARPTGVDPPPSPMTGRVKPDYRPLHVAAQTRQYPTSRALPEILAIGHVPSIPHKPRTGTRGSRWRVPSSAPHSHGTRPRATAAPRRTRPPRRGRAKNGETAPRNGRSRGRP